MMKNPAAYIEHLQVVNRAKRDQHSLERLKKDELAEKEQNFQVFFSGANQAKGFKARETSKSPSSTNANYADLHRRKWGKPKLPQMLRPKTRSVLLKPPLPRQPWRAGNVSGPLPKTGTPSLDLEAYDLYTRLDRLNECNKRRLSEFLDELEAQQGT